MANVCFDCPSRTTSNIHTVRAERLSPHPRTREAVVVYAHLLVDLNTLTYVLVLGECMKFNMMRAWVFEGPLRFVQEIRAWRGN